MRRMLWMLVVSALVAACGSDEGSASDPYAIIWVRNELDSAATDSFYRLILVKVNQDSLIAVVADINPGEQKCFSYAGFPDDSLDIQLWLAAYTSGDTLRSATFMPLTGPTPDSAAHWGVFFRDSAVVTQEDPPNWPSCTF